MIKRRMRIGMGMKMVSSESFIYSFISFFGGGF